MSVLAVSSSNEQIIIFLCHREEEFLLSGVTPLPQASPLKIRGEKGEL
jgi:hypothetical protein